MGGAAANGSQQPPSRMPASESEGERESEEERGRGRTINHHCTGKDISSAQEEGEGEGERAHPGV